MLDVGQMATSRGDGGMTHALSTSKQVKGWERWRGMDGNGEGQVALTLQSR
jgi:hypothetical protein